VGDRSASHLNICPEEAIDAGAVGGYRAGGATLRLRGLGQRPSPPESGAILAFLAEGTELLPCDGFERASVVRWLLFEQSDIVPMIGGVRFRLLTGRWTRDDPEVGRRRAGAHEVLDILESHLQREPFLAARRYTIADIAAYGYLHVAQDADLDMEPSPATGRWLERVRSQPGHLDDLEPYPANARPGAGRSVYD
jgi:glutathione S-transferase